MTNTTNFSKKLVALPFFLFLLISYVLPPPQPIEYKQWTLDDSWQVILTRAFLGGTQFGRDLVFTYGPWGFLAAPRGSLQIYPFLVCGRLLIGGAFFLGIIQISRRCLRSTILQFLFLSWMVVIGDPITLLPMTLLAVLLISDDRTNHALKIIIHLLAIACALCVWVKFTSFAVIVALAIALASVDLMRRRVPIIPIEMFTFSIAFWLMARQSITVMPQFLAGAISVARSHPEEMFAGGYKGVIWALAVAPPAVALFGYSLFKNKDWRRLPLFGFVLFFVALQLKEALNRYDPGHVWGG